MSSDSNASKSQRAKRGKGKRHPKSHDDLKAVINAAHKGAKVASKSSPIDELTILNLNSQEFDNWKQHLVIYLTRVYGQHGRDLIFTGKKMTPPRPEGETITVITEDMSAEEKTATYSHNELNREINKARVNQYMKQLQKIEEDMTAIYAVIWGQLSDASQAKIRSVTPDFVTIERQSKTVELWAAVVKVHQASISGCKELDQEDARNKYQRLACNNGESLVSFRTRFDACVRALVAVELEEPAEKDQAIRFLTALDDQRFGGFKTMLQNNAQMGASDIPTNLADMVKLATNFKVVVNGSSGGGSGTVFVTQAANVQMNKANSHAKSDNHGNGGNKQSKKAKKKSGDKSDNGKSDKKSGDKPKVKCNFCQGDHYQRDCSGFKEAAEKYMASKSTSSASTGRMNVVAASEIPEHLMFTVCTDCAYPVSGGSRDLHVLLDNQASVSVYHSSKLVRNIRDAGRDQHVRVLGINGEAELMLTKIADTEWFGTVYYHPKASANVLSLGKVEELEGVTVTYQQGDAFMVTMENGPTFEFTKTVIDQRNGGALFMCKFNPWRAHVLITTVADNEAKYTKAEVLRAKEAKKVIANMGYPSVASFLKVISHGAITDLPVTAADVKLALDIYGPDTVMLRGKSKQRKSQPIRDESIPRFIETRQSLHADLMYVDKEPYFVSISKPMYMIMATYLGGTRNKDGLRGAINAHLGGYKSRGFEVHMLFSDCEGGVAALVLELSRSGVAINFASPGQHVPLIENSIKVIKERIRCNLVSLPFKLPKTFMKWLVAYSVGRINMIPSRASGDFVCPREKFLGRKTSYKRDIRIGFMQSVLVPVTSDEQTNSVRQERMFTALALVPTGNLQGSVVFYSLATGKTVTRESWKETPMTDEVIAQLEALEPSPSIENDFDPIVTMGQSQQAIASLPGDEDDLPPEFDTTPGVDDQQDASDAEESPPLYSSGDEGAVIEDNQVVMKGFVPETLSPDFQYWTYSAERAESIAEDQRAKKIAALPPGADIAEVYNISLQKAIQAHGVAAWEAIFSEMMQMLEKKVFSPVDMETLTREQQFNVIRSKLFLTLKFDALGFFLKIKGRLVAGGDMQDRNLYEESSTSSPTCSLGALMMVIGIAAKEHRHVYTVDIGGAYLNADMKADVYMRLDPKVAEVVCALDPSYRDYMEERGSIVVKLNKALYGCIESGKLWYDKLVSILCEIGFVPNPQERCVFNLSRDKTQMTIAVYVDDLLITCCDDKWLDEMVEKTIPSHLDEVKVKKGKVHSFLGMTLDFSEEGKVSITMPSYISDMLEEFGVVGKAKTPALPTLFEIRESPLLPADKAKDFHRWTAMLLYLPKRCRPDIAVAVQFLSTRVQHPTEDDMGKLNRVMQYLNGTRALGIRIQPEQGDINLRAYVDASYGVHADGKSHTGCVITLGKGPVYIKSGKQKINTKSSTEAELVGLSDQVSQVIWSRDFLTGQGYAVGTATVYQDNVSTIALASNGQSNSERTRHINLRYFWVKDRIASGEIKLEHMPTTEMTADILTKPLQGQLFMKMRSALLNWVY